MSFSVVNDPRAPEVHASSLLLVQNELLSVWFGGTKEGHPDTKIWLSRRPLNHENGWCRPEVVAYADGVAHWNPVLFSLPESEHILLFYKRGSPISSWSTWVKHSYDRGVSWTHERPLVPGDKGGRGPVKNKCLVLSDGSILAPASTETPEGRWDCFTDRSIDGGEQWLRSSTVHIDRDKLPGEGAIQPSLIETAPGKVTMLTRSSTGYVLRSDSIDGGKTWSEMRNTALLNNNSGIDALKYQNRTWLVVHNPVSQRWGPRTPLVVSRSDDEGASWRIVVVLEDKPPPSDFERIEARDTGIINDGQSEYSYPAIISDGIDGVYISYTYERRAIKHVHLTAEQLG